ncbi:nuclear transport factor 2 family protein [Corynebacterium lubricantis]|uniref:nuclear transport factor 2 family protein n=1 Tax=Corynebacterium lubricantis TaxID=541095 RepID=UPI00036E9CBF|nr:nuclear transport factor 2 family protein [Corynebacterium lubricantis]
MALTNEDLITRTEIHDALVAYSQGLDQRNWDLYDKAWTEEATFEAPDEGIEPIKATDLKKLLQSSNDSTRLSGQHLLNNTHYHIDGDTARTITEVSWVTLQTTDKPNIVFEVRAGGMYVDDLEKTEAGWRIAKRILVTKNKSTRGVFYTDERIANIRDYALNTNWYK